MTDQRPGLAVDDRGCRRDGVEANRLLISSTRRGLTPKLIADLRRRSVIEAEIGHMKTDGRLSRCPLKDTIGDALFATLCARGHNIRKILAHLRVWLASIVASILNSFHHISLNKFLKVNDLPQGALHGDAPVVGKGGGAGDRRGRLIGRTKGSINTKLHALADADGRPIRFFMTAGPLSVMQASPVGQRVSDYTGAAALLSSLPKAGWLFADLGYDADWFREALMDKGIKPCIQGRKSHGMPIKP